MNASLKDVVRQAYRDAFFERACLEELAEQNKAFGERIERLEWVVYELTQENEKLWRDSRIDANPIFLKSILAEGGKHPIKGANRKIAQNEKVIAQLNETVRELIERAMRNQKKLNG
mgnify:CR=1 FL=1